MASLTSENKLQCKSMVLKLHTLFDIPRELVSLDSRRERIELVLKPTAKYYSENKRFCKLELPEQCVAFSPSSIIFKGDRFMLDFYSAPPPCGETTTAARVATPQQASSCANHVPANTTELYPPHGLFSINTSGVASSTGKMNLPSDADGFGSGGGTGFVSKLRSAFGDYAADDDHEGNTQGHAPGKLKTSKTANAAPPSFAGALTSNEVTLRYPTRSDLKVIIEVMVAARQRRHDSSTVRWITPSWADRSTSSSISTFAAADGEVVRHKLVNRFVGLTVGHLSCTMELPHAAEDLREVCAFHPSAVAEAAERLCDDNERLHRFHAHATAEQLHKLREKRPQWRSAFVERLQSGASEASVYRALLLELCPTYYLRCIHRICTMYPPTPQNSAWVHTDAEKLAAEYEGREMELIRSLCAELGPDLSAISPRNRFLSYTNVQPLGEELWRWIRENFADQENDILDYEPDVFMEALALHYGTPEPIPIQYGFPPISYELDRRAYFCDSLRFPVNREHHRYRDEALAARQCRVPLQLTPNERPHYPIRPTSRNVGEIDILLEKYKPEFVQIVPSIADAMESVTQHNERLLQRLLRDAQQQANTASVSGTRERMRSLPYEVCPHGFQLFQSERATGTYMALLNRFAEYTYISPSTLLSAVIYLDRLCLRHPRLLLTSRNIEKLLVAAVRVASKVVDLRSVNNKNFANVFSLMIQDMNDLESGFLNLMGFDFFLSPKEFANYSRLVQLPPACPPSSSSGRLSSGNPTVAGNQSDAARGGGVTTAVAMPTSETSTTGMNVVQENESAREHTHDVGGGVSAVRRSLPSRASIDTIGGGSGPTAIIPIVAASSDPPVTTSTGRLAGVSTQSCAPPPRGTTIVESSGHTEDASGNGGPPHRPSTSPSVASPTRPDATGHGWPSATDANGSNTGVATNQAGVTVVNTGVGYKPVPMSVNGISGSGGMAQAEFAASTPALSIS